MEEKEAFQLVKEKLLKDLIDNNELDPMAPVDWYSPKNNIGIEYKNRSKYYSSVIIEKKKYLELIKYDKSIYLNAIPNGNGNTMFWSFNLKEIPFQPIWVIDQYNQTTEFQNRKQVNKLVWKIPLIFGKDITLNLIS